MSSITDAIAAATAHAEKSKTVSPEATPTAVNNPAAAIAAATAATQPKEVGVLDTVQGFAADRKEDIEALSRGVQKGVTFGFDDEMLAAQSLAADMLMELMPDKVQKLSKDYLGFDAVEVPDDATLKERYLLNLKAVDDEYAQLSTDNPIMSLGGEMAGAVASAAATGGATGLTSLAARSGKLVKTGLAAVGGALQGGLFAFDDDASVGAGAALGGILGGAMYPATTLVGKIAKGVRNKYGKIDSKAMDYIADKLSIAFKVEKDKIPYHKIQAQLDELGEDAMPADIHGVLMDAAEDITASKNLNSTTFGFTQKLADRGRNAPQQLLKETDELLGTAAPRTRVEIKADFSKDRDLIGKQRVLAIQASDVSIPTNTAGKAITNHFTPKGQGSTANKAVAKALQSKLTASAKGEAQMNVQDLLDFRVEIDDILDGTTKVKKLSTLKTRTRRKLEEFRGELNKTIHADEAVAKADEAFATSYTMDKAIDLGVGVMKGSTKSQHIADFMATANQVQTQGFMVGAKRAIVDAIEADPQVVLKKLAKGGDFYKKLERVMGAETLDDLISASQKSLYFQKTADASERAISKAARERSASSHAKNLVDAGILAARAAPIPQTLKPSNVAAAGAARNLAQTQGVDLSRGTAENVMEMMGAQGGDASAVLRQLMQHSQSKASGLPPLIGGAIGGVAGGTQGE